MTTTAGIRCIGLSGGSRFKVGVPIHPNAIIGSIRPLPTDGIPVFDPRIMRIKREYEMQVNLGVTPGVCFGDGCNAVKRLPVIRTLQHIANQVSSVIESFAPEFQ
jgi:hypothetical protein